MEIRANAKNELLHSMFVTKMVYAECSDLPDIDEITAETFVPDKSLRKEVFHRWQLILDLFKNNSFI